MRGLAGFLLRIFKPETAIGLEQLRKHEHAWIQPDPESPFIECECGALGYDTGFKRC